MAKTAPKGLADTGRRLWRDITKDYELRPDEYRVLEDACREADLVDRLQVELDEGDEALIVKGSMGQPTANPMIGELRQHRTTFQKLMASLKLPDEQGSGAGERSSSARAAAEARWGQRGA